MGIITAEALYPATYTTSQSEISDLGAMRPPDSIILQPSATIFNTTMIASGLMIVGGAYFVHRALRRTSLAFALFGSVLGVVGLGVMAAGALTHVVEVRLSDLYHAPGATPEDQASLVALWEMTEGLFDALLIAGLVILPIALISLGIAMLGSAAFGRGFGGLGVALGVVESVAAIGLLIDPLAAIPALISVLALIVFLSPWGGKSTVCRGSRGNEGGTMKATACTEHGPSDALWLEER